MNEPTPLWLRDIRTLVMETSSTCVANCPFCSRKQKKRAFAEQFITLEDFSFLPGDLFPQLRQISFAGNFGDFCTNPEMPEIAAHIVAANPDILIYGDTNGSAQDEDWWRRLGTSFGNGFVVFALDGLADTHRRHRKGTDFEAIIRNIRAFVRGGGKAHWKFIVFEHNEHQLGEAEALAREIGCSRFFAIPSRYYNEELHKPKTLDVQLRLELVDSHWEEIKRDKILAACKPTANHSLFIGADGTVLPCCYAHIMWVTEYDESFRFMVDLLEEHYESINFKTRPLREIVEGEFFRQVLKQSRYNKFCRLKCNKYTKAIRRDVLVRDSFFD